MAGQFAKKVPENHNYQYMIFAYFAHNIFTTEKGILYPSVQTHGHLGFNVAIRLDVKEDVLEFLDAKWNILYKVGNYLPVSEGLHTASEIESFLNIQNINQLAWIY